MGRFFLSFFLFMPLFGFSQNEVGPDGDKLLIIILTLLLIPLVLFVVGKWRKTRKGYKKAKPFFQWKKLKLILLKDRKFKPKVLTLKVENISTKDTDIEAPVLYFRKLWKIRKFKLKGINRSEIYPLYLEKGKTHELRIDLSVFHQHDRKLRKFYWAKVRLRDTNGERYSTRHIILRKSLFS